MYIQKIVVCICLFFFIACKNKEPVNSFTEAQQYMEKREWKSAEACLEKYLREEEQVQLRFEAWNALLYLGSQLNYTDRWKANYLEEMFVEFEKKQEYVTPILWQLVFVCEHARMYERSEFFGEKLLMQSGLSPEEQARVLRNLSTVNVKLRRFDRAEEQLNACLELPIQGVLRLECLLDKADVATCRDSFDEGKRYAQLILDSEEALETIKAKATFILADINEQQGNVKQAIELFRAIRDLYPNEMVVDQRLQTLQAKIE